MSTSYNLTDQIRLALSILINFIIITNLLDMIKKTRNYSLAGYDLDNNFLSQKTLRKNPAELKSMLYNKSLTRLTAPTNRIKKLEDTTCPFGSQTSREKLSSFQKNYIKGQGNDLIHHVVDQLARRTQPNFSLRRQQDQRLSNLMPKKPKINPINPEHPIKQFCKQEQNHSSQILTTRQLQKHRKGMHHLDFDKQITRQGSSVLYLANSNAKQSKPSGKGFLLAQSKINRDFDRRITDSGISDGFRIKYHSIHSFGSYTKRRFLQSRELIKRAGSSSGIQFHKIPLQKVKGNFKMQSVPKLQTLGRDRKMSMRNQRTEQLWLTKLQYDSTANKKQTLKNSLNFKRQLARKEFGQFQAYNTRLGLKGY